MTAFPKIIVAGASGYIGKAMLPKLLEKFPNAEITALSRSQQSSDDPRITWKACDLFSLKSLEEAVPQQVDLALYLVHSMGPTAQLDQGSFADYDLILADNFARALKGTKVRQLIYLGGLIPETPHLSLHLQSRLEVEETFLQYDFAMTTFRAGLILGEAGSSFQILLKLVKRLPVMLCPKWTQTLTTPVDLITVLNALTQASLNENFFLKTYDLAGCYPITYIDMMRETARRIGKKKYFFTVPLFTPTLSRLWVSLITNTPKNLVYPLVESLAHEMVARESHLFSRDCLNRSYFDLLENASLKIHSGRSLFRFRAQRKTVRSVQRLLLPQGKDAKWMMDQYIHWLPKFLAPLVKVKLDSTSVYFSLLTSQALLLELNLNEKRSHVDRQLLYIIKGLLVADDNRGRLEFRVVLNRKFVLAAIHDYKPSLQWLVYKYTQAKIHLLVMNAFSRRMKKYSESCPPA
jgi:uncharacterized protein YbjT (DUF2867 family)